MTNRKRAEVEVGHDPVPVAGHGVALDRGQDRVQTPPVRLVEVDELIKGVRLRAAHLARRHVGDRQQRTAPTAERVVHVSVFEHRVAAVRAAAEARRQETPASELFDRVPGLPFGRRRQHRELDQLDVGQRLHPTHHLHAILRADDVPQEGVRQVHEHRVAPVQGHHRAGVVKLPRVAQGSFSRRHFDETPGKRFRRGHKMELAVGHVKRPDGAVGRREKRHFAAGEQHHLLFRSVPFLDSL